MELGPGAGPDGGRVLFAGAPAAIGTAEGSVLAPFLTANDVPAPPPAAAAIQTLPDDAGTPFVPRGFTLLTGPGADGRVRDLAAAADRDGWAGKKVGGFGEVLFAPRGPLTRSARSTAATFLGFFGEVRAMFAATPEAKLRGVRAGAFLVGRGLRRGGARSARGRGRSPRPMQFSCRTSSRSARSAAGSGSSRRCWRSACGG